MWQGAGAGGEEKVIQITAIRELRAQQKGRTYKENRKDSAREVGGRLWGSSKQGPDWGRRLSTTGAVGDEMPSVQGHGG